MSSSTVPPTGAAPGASGASTTHTGAAPASGTFKGFTVPAILTWKNPQETGILYAEALGAWLVLSSTFTLRLFLRAAYWTVGVLSVVEFLTRKVNGPRGGLVSNYAPSRHLPISDQVIHDISAAVASAFRKAVFGVQHVLDARSPCVGIKLAGFFWVSYVLLGLFPLKWLLLAVIVLTFSLPPLYLQFKRQIDDAVRQAQGHVHAHIADVNKAVYDKAGPQIEAAKRLLGKRGGFPSHNGAGVAPLKEVPGSAANTREFSGASTGASTGVSTGTSTGAHTAAPTGASAAHGSIPVETKTTTTTSTAHVPPEVLSQYDSVPTLVGNVKIDQATKDKFAADASNLRSSIEKDKQGL